MTRMQFLAGLFVMGAMSLAGSFLAVYVMQSPVLLNAQDGAAETVVAGEFQLKDNNGKLRALMKVDDDGELLFTLLDANENVRVTQSVANNGAGAIVLSDAQGRPRMSLTGDVNDSGAFSVFDSSGEPAAMLAVGEGDFPLLTLRAPTGEAILGLQKDGSGVFNLTSISGQGDELSRDQYFSVVGGTSGPTVMLLENTRGGGEIQLTAAEDGNTILSIRESQALRALLSSGGGDSTAFQLDNGSGSKVYLQAQKSGAGVLQLNGGENYVRAMSSGDGEGEFAIVKGKTFAWKQTGK